MHIDRADAATAMNFPGIIRLKQRELELQWIV